MAFLKKRFGVNRRMVNPYMSVNGINFLNDSTSSALSTSDADVLTCGMYNTNVPTPVSYNSLKRGPLKALTSRFNYGHAVVLAHNPCFTEHDTLSAKNVDFTGISDNPSRVPTIRIFTISVCTNRVPTDRVSTRYPNDVFSTERVSCSVKQGLRQWSGMNSQEVQ